MAHQKRRGGYDSKILRLQRSVNGVGVDIPITFIPTGKIRMLRKLLARTERGHKLLVPDGMPTDRAINALELFIYRHRNEISDEGSDRRLTFHGLRHTYAAEKYTKLTEGGMSAIDAHYAVSRLLGRERADVTNIYLASVRKRGRDGE